MKFISNKIIPEGIEIDYLIIGDPVPQSPGDTVEGLKADGYSGLYQPHNHETLEQIKERVAAIKELRICCYQLILDGGENINGCHQLFVDGINERNKLLFKQAV